MHTAFESIESETIPLMLRVLIDQQGMMTPADVLAIVDLIQPHIEQATPRLRTVGLEFLPKFREAALQDAREADQLMVSGDPALSTGAQE